jgi:hypothetical protein
LKTASGVHVRAWRDAEYTLGYVLISTFDKGTLVILVRNDGMCGVIGKYSVKGGRFEGDDALDYQPKTDFKMLPRIRLSERPLASAPFSM